MLDYLESGLLGWVEVFRSRLGVLDYLESEVAGADRGCQGLAGMPESPPPGLCRKPPPGLCGKPPPGLCRKPPPGLCGKPPAGFIVVLVPDQPPSTASSAPSAAVPPVVPPVVPPADVATAPAVGPPAVLTDAEVLVEVTRDGFVESVHRIAAVVTDPAGAVVLATSDPAGPILPRSALKPVQTLAMLRAGLDLPPDLLALATASHSAEPFHLDGVRRILAGAGLTEADLQNTPDLPYPDDERAAWVAAGRGPASIVQGCSGKHAGMLATCVAAGWDIGTYLDPAHPLQRLVAETLAEVAGEPVAATVVDGCGAPALAVSLTGLARVFGRFAAAPAGSHEARIADAMRSHPEFVAGTGRDVTALMRGTPGAIAKDGAEGVYAVGLPDGRGVAVKVVDGSDRARAVALATVLRRIDVESAAYPVLESAPVFGHGEPVGAVAAVRRHPNAR